MGKEITAAESNVVSWPDGKPLIFAQMAKIQSEAEGLVKGQENQQQKFKFRGIDDAYNYLHDIFARNQVFSVPVSKEVTREERTSKHGSALIFTTITIDYRFYAIDGSYITATVVGEAMDSGDKSVAKALSMAHKNVLFQVTMLPTTVLAEADAETHVAMPKPPEHKQPEVPFAIRDQVAEIEEFRAMGQTTDEMNKWLDEHGRGTKLTYKQAEKLIAKLREENK